MKLTPETEYPCCDLNIHEMPNGHVAVKYTFNPIALRKANIVCNFGLSECNRVKPFIRFQCGYSNTGVGYTSYPLSSHLRLGTSLDCTWMFAILDEMFVLSAKSTSAN